MRSGVSVSVGHAARTLAPLAVEDRHLLGVVALAGGRAGRHRAPRSRRGRPAVSSSSSAPSASASRSRRARADQRHDVVAAGEHPGDRDLRDGRALRLGDRAQRLDEREVALEVLAGEAGRVAAEVAWRAGRAPSTSGR